MVITMIQPPAVEMRNDYVRVSYDTAKGTWGVASGDGRIFLRDGCVVVRLPGKEVRAEGGKGEAKEERGKDGLGEYVRLRVTYAGLAGLDELTWSATLRPESRYAIIQATCRPARGGPVQRQGRRRWRRSRAWRSQGVWS